MDGIAELRALVAKLRRTSGDWQNPEQRLLDSAADALDKMPALLDRLEAAEIALCNIVDCYEMRGELYTNDADCAGTLHDKARAALAAQGDKS